MATVGAHGRGGVTRRRDGRLQVALTMTSGERVYRTIPRMTDPKRQRELANRALRELVRLREAELDPAGQTLAEYLRWWLASVASATHRRIRPNTLAFYRIMAERHVIPTLGDVALVSLTERHVQSWLDGLTVSPQYVSHCRAFLRRVLNVAYRQRLIERNPAVGVELPRIPKYRAAPMTFDETKRLLGATVDDRLGALWRLAVVTGLRIGELTALTWDDLDLGAGFVSVTSRLAIQDGEWVRVPLKADRDLERMSIDAQTVRLLDAHRIRQAAGRTASWRYWGLVFTTTTGLPLDRRRTLEAFHEACDRAGIARRRVHDIRHSNSTQMRDLGIDREVRKARHGHSTDEMDARYSRASETQDRVAVERLAEAIR